MIYHLKHKVTGEELELSIEHYQQFASRSDMRHFDVTVKKGGKAASSPPQEVEKDLTERKAAKEKS